MTRLLQITIATLLVALTMAISIARYEYQLKEKAEANANAVQKTFIQSAKIIERYLASKNHPLLTSVPNAPGLQERYKNEMAISRGLVDTVATALRIARRQIRDITQIASLAKSERFLAQKNSDSLQNLIYNYKNKLVKLNHGFNNIDSKEYFRYDITEPN